MISDDERMIQRSAVREIQRGELRAPAEVLDIDLGRTSDTETVDVTRFETVWCLVRRDGVAIATRFFDVASDTSLATSVLREHIAASKPAQPVVQQLSELSDDASLTVAICTRDRPERLLATLASLARQSDPNFDVVIVDNSSDGSVAGALDRFEQLKIRCYHEPTPGLSRARNRALREVRSDFIAWIDDDELADRDWVAWIKRGFAVPDRPAAVAGVMLPAELETAAQVDFERYGGFNKGRDMAPIRLRAGTPAVADPLYPLPGFGAGGNMAFRTDALRAIGGFDNRLGAGTLSCGGEETLALSLLLVSGGLILHWPPAVTWHYHRRTEEELEKQFFGYSAGLTAYYMSLILSSPNYVLRILGFMPRGIKRIQANKAAGVLPGGPPADFPEQLLRAGRKGLYQGAWLYLREAHRQRRSARTTERLNPGGAR